MIYDIIAETIPKERDTVLALTMYRILAQNANRYAFDWWELLKWNPRLKYGSTATNVLAAAYAPPTVFAGLSK